MKLEQQIVSLELAQKLKELGVKQESYFYHHFSEFGSSVILEGEEHLSIIDDTGHRREFVGYVSAFTVAELGELLPKNVSFPIPQRENKGWLWRNENGNNFTDTEANARALLLIHLLENKFITL